MVVIVECAAVARMERAVGEAGQPGEAMRDGSEEIQRERAVGEEVRVERRVDREEPAGTGKRRAAGGVARLTWEVEAHCAEDDLALVRVQVVVGVPVDTVEP